MGFTIETGVPVFTVFLQGILSFFSPCIFPLVPLYISYLSGGAREVDENGMTIYPRKKVLLNTLFFVLGISFAFFVLGMGVTALGEFFGNNRIWFARISGIIMILFGMYQFGLFGQSKTLGQEHRLPFQLDKYAMGPLPALLLGFTFSFAWTPCVGPVLSSVLLMAGSAGSSGKGFWLIAVYTLGFVLPFLAVGLFTGKVLESFKKHRNIVTYTVKAGAALLILMGLMTLTGFMNGMTDYLSDADGIQLDAGITAETEETQEEGTEQKAEEAKTNAEQKAEEAEPAEESGEAKDAEAETNKEQETETEKVEPSEDTQETGKVQETEKTESPETEEAERPEIPAPDFTLVDQYGNEHTLSDYKGKTVFLNFWATWCPPCKGEMPEIQKLYEAYGENEEDLIVLGIAAPEMGREGDIAHITEFLEKNGYTFPVVMDETGMSFMTYGIQAFPTTFMIDSEGNVFGYVDGAITGDIMESIVQQTMEGR